MATLLLPVSSVGNQRCYEGYILSKNPGRLGYRVRLTIPQREIKDARFECDWKLKCLLRGHEATLKQRLSESLNIDQFLLEVRTLVQRLEGCMSLEKDSIMQRSSCVQLMADLEELGWSRVVYVNSSLTTIKLSTHDSVHREHILTLAVSSQYPSKPPDVSADVPVVFKPRWTSRSGSGGGGSSSLVSLVEQFEQWLEHFEHFWKLLDEVDSKCWILEPENPTRASTYRRIVIGDNLSLRLVLEPLSLTTPPQLTFLGADHDVLPLIGKQNTALHSWNPKNTILCNLKDIFSLSFPPPPKDSSHESSGECAICYAYRLDGQTPSIVCDNIHCARPFHSQCLYDWFSSLQTVKHLDKIITGECLFCSQSISISSLPPPPPPPPP